MHGGIHCLQPLCVVKVSCGRFEAKHVVSKTFKVACLAPHWDVHVHNKWHVAGADSTDASGVDTAGPLTVDAHLVVYVTHPAQQPRSLFLLVPAHPTPIG